VTGKQALPQLDASLSKLIIFAVLRKPMLALQRARAMLPLSRLSRWAPMAYCRPELESRPTSYHNGLITTCWLLLRNGFHITTLKTDLADLKALNASPMCCFTAKSAHKWWADIIVELPSVDTLFVA